MAMQAVGSKPKTALVTGITGQDGSYLAQFLIDKGYIVHGLRRRSSSFNTNRIDHLVRDVHDRGVRLFLHYGDLTDASALSRIVNTIVPDEIYNLGAQSHVAVSFVQPEYTCDVNAMGTLRLLEAIRGAGLAKTTRFYQASTSELYGKIQEVPQTETTPFYPRSPYGVSKLMAHWMTINYREAYGLYGCNGILFNHESPVRGETFVTRKITRAIARIKLGLQEKLYLGNLGALRDWGHARDYVEMQWLMLQQDKPRDYVIATGIQRSVREFVLMAAARLDMVIDFRGAGLDEKGYDKAGRCVVEVDPAYFRPTEVETLLGDASLARKELGWKPRMTLEAMVHEMVDADYNAAQREQMIKTSGL